MTTTERPHTAIADGALPPASAALELVRAMMRIRTVEETLADLYKEQEMRTPTHFSIGQEAVAVGVSGALRPTDVAYSGHRCHAHYLAKGGDLRGMVAELYGRETGCARGRGGSVHLNAPEVGFIAASAILGETMAAAAGSAWSFAMDRSPRIAVSYFGDGVVEEGIFHETLNFAVVKQVPLLLICENNLYSTHTPLEVRQPSGTTIWERVRSYQLPSVIVDGNDVFAVLAAAEEGAAWCREGKGPYFIECSTYRWREHVGPNWDYDAGYRTKAEVDSWIAKDPVKRAQAAVVAAGYCGDEQIITWSAELQQEIAEAVAYAKASPFPSVETLLDGTY